MQAVLVSFVGLLVSVSWRFIGAVHWGPIEILLAGGAFIALRRQVDILWVVLVGGILAALVF